MEPSAYAFRERGGSHDGTLGVNRHRRESVARVLTSPLGPGERSAVADEDAPHLEIDDTLPSTSPDAVSDEDDSDDGAIEGVSSGLLLDGRYRIVKLLGAGGMGAVYEARNERIDRAVAVKFLQPDMARDKELVTRFLQEARTASQVHHRHIVEVLDSGQEGDLVWLVMELLRGESLQSLMDREGPLDPERARTLLDPICAALSHVHSLGIIHRDIKPDNVFLATVPGVDEPVPKLLDFGVARCLTDRAMRLTATGDLLGTPAYMSPEQCMGQRDLTALADQYALGATLFEMLSGKLPHVASNYNELVVKRATEDATRLETVRPELSRAWCDLVAKSLARRPEERFASIDAMREAMRAIGRESAVEPTPEASPVSVVIAPVAAPAVPPTPSRSRFAVGATFAVALGLSIAWSATRGAAPTSSTTAVTTAPPRVEPITPAPVTRDAEVASAEDAAVVPVATIAAHDAATEPERHGPRQTREARRSARSRIDRTFPGGP